MGTAFNYVRGTLEERFWTKVQKGALDECWEWQASIDSRGYGNIGLPRNDGTGRYITQRAHRIAFLLANGLMNIDLVVRHSCDNRRCCNPAHLSLGTQSENMTDAVKRGRLLRAGEHNGRAKLRKEDIAAIRCSTDSLRALAARYGVAKTTIASARSGQTWT